MIRHTIRADMAARPALYTAAFYIAATLAVGFVLAYLAERARVRAMVAETRASLEGQGQALVLRMAYAHSGEDSAVVSPDWESAT